MKCEGGKGERERERRQAGNEAGGHLSLEMENDPCVSACPFLMHHHQTLINSRVFFLFFSPLFLLPLLMFICMPKKNKYLTSNIKMTKTPLENELIFVSLQL